LPGDLFALGHGLRADAAALVVAWADRGDRPRGRACPARRLDGAVTASHIGSGGIGQSRVGEIHVGEIKLAARLAPCIAAQ
jgi:hypothetical protein